VGEVMTIGTSYDASDAHAAPRYALTQFTVEEFFQFWEYLEAALDRVPHTWRHWTKEYICTSIANGTMQMWGVGRPPKATLIVMTMVNVYPTMRVLNIAWAVGAFEDDMLPLLDATFTDFARLNSCDEIEIRGRLGWESKLRGIGFTREAAVWTRSVPRVTLN
jgi:hypothetical protein